MLQKADLLPPTLSCQDQLGDDAVVRVVNDHVAVVENIDVFTPIHDDPFTQGEIVACNATNDVFAMGVTDIISLQTFLAYPADLPEEVVVGVLKGMNKFMKRLGAEVSGGQTIRNPVPVFGGVCLGVAHPRNIVYSNGAKVGNAVLLTKPLGIQPAMRSYRDLRDEKREKLLKKFAESDLVRMQDTAVRLMTHSNRDVAIAMTEVGVNASTDITGFGLLGHAGNIAILSDVSIIIDKMPVISGTLELAKFFGHRLAEGYGAETAGGMLVCLAPQDVERFGAILKASGLPCWTIGRVVESSGQPSAKLDRNVEYIETEFP